MPELRRRLMTIYPPMLVDTFCGLQKVVEAEFPGAMVEYDETGTTLHIVITEHVENDDPRLILKPMDRAARVDTRTHKETKNGS